MPPPSRMARDGRYRSFIVLLLPVRRCRDDDDGTSVCKSRPAGHALEKPRIEFCCTVAIDQEPAAIAEPRRSVLELACSDTPVGLCEQRQLQAWKLEVRGPRFPLLTRRETEPAQGNDVGGRREREVEIDATVDLRLRALRHAPATSAAGDPDAD